VEAQSRFVSSLSCSMQWPALPPPCVSCEPCYGYGDSARAAGVTTLGQRPPTEQGRTQSGAGCCKATCPGSGQGRAPPCSSCICGRRGGRWASRGQGKGCRFGPARVEGGRRGYVTATGHLVCCLLSYLPSVHCPCQTALFRLQSARRPPPHLPPHPTPRSHRGRASEQAVQGAAQGGCPPPPPGTHLAIPPLSVCLKR
jgi:hypothetical protein